MPPVVELTVFRYHVTVTVDGVLFPFLQVAKMADTEDAAVFRQYVLPPEMEVNDVMLTVALTTFPERNVNRTSPIRR